MEVSFSPSFLSQIAVTAVENLERIYLLLLMIILNFIIYLNRIRKIIGSVTTLKTMSIIIVIFNAVLVWILVAWGFVDYLRVEVIWFREFMLFLVIIIQGSIVLE